MKLAALWVLACACACQQEAKPRPPGPAAPVGDAAATTPTATAPAATVPALAAPITLGFPGETPCVQDGLPDPSKTKVALLARQAKGGRAAVEVGLQNTGSTRICIYTHVATHEVQSDWLTIGYSDGTKYHHFMRMIELDDDRDKSAAVATALAPGETLWMTVDVDAWARRARNGAEPLPAGSLYAQAFYDSSREKDAWAGKLMSEPFELRVP